MGPRGSLAKAARSFPEGVGPEDGQTDDGTALLPGTLCSGQNPQSTSRVARQHKCWRQRHQGIGEGVRPGGSLWGRSGAALLSTRESAGRCRARRRSK